MIPLITVKILQGLASSYLKKLISMMSASHYQLGYLNDSNDAAHFVDTDVECPIYMLESNNYYQSIERTHLNLV